MLVLFRIFYSVNSWKGVKSPLKVLFFYSNVSLFKFVFVVPSKIKNRRQRSEYKNVIGSSRFAKLATLAAIFGKKQKIFFTFSNGTKTDTHIRASIRNPSLQGARRFEKKEAIDFKSI